MPASRIDLTITLAPGTDAAAAAKRLVAAGLEVGEVLDAVGVVLGRAPKSAKAKLAKVDGVADVAVTPTFEVGPPDAELS